MKNTFLNRVSAERNVLSLVNNCNNKNPQLAGLSSAAVESWLRSAEISNHDLVREKLFQLSALCQRLSDRSRETFLDIDANKAAEIENEIEKLKSLLV